MSKPQPAGSARSGADTPSSPSIEQADYDAAEKLIAAVETVRATPAGDAEYEAGLAVIEAVAEIRAAARAEERERCARVMRTLHHALELTKNDAEKNGFQYGSQSVCVLALKAFDRWRIENIGESEERTSAHNPDFSR